jgi:hypothetical protein
MKEGEEGEREEKKGGRLFFYFEN